MIEQEKNSPPYRRCIDILLKKKNRIIYQSKMQSSKKALSFYNGSLSNALNTFRGKTSRIKQEKNTQIEKSNKLLFNKILTIFGRTSTHSIDNKQ